MDHSLLWSLVDSSRDECREFSLIPRCLTEKLLRLKPEEIIAYERARLEIMNDANRWDLWAVAYIVNNGCSDDCFEYFRGWLILQGQQKWVRALETPECIGDWQVCLTTGEKMLSAATKAFAQSTGKQLPSLDVEVKLEPDGNEWDEDDLPGLYPRLWDRFGGSP